jgi:N-acetylated-alpha-linked acidic dipeptidase
MTPRAPLLSLLFLALCAAALRPAECIAQAAASAQQGMPPLPTQVFGFRDFSGSQASWDKAFLAVPSARLAGEHLRTLTAAPHPASSEEDRQTAEYVARKFREAGLQTDIVSYKVVLAFPKDIRWQIQGPDGFTLNGPRPEHVANDPGQNDPRILTPYNASSASGDVTADVVYANYGTPEDFQHLADLHIDLRGKLLLVRYGANFRGVKAFLAQKYGAAGVLIYSDPADDGYAMGDVYPNGPWRPASGIQRGSINYIFEYAGDPTTPGIASTPDLPANKRTALKDSAAEPHVLAVPLSAQDASPLLERLQGPAVPHSWQGALPFTYHVGPGPVRVHLTVKESYDLHTIWDVIGKIPGSAANQEIVTAGNHRDAWVYGATDPSSGTAAMLESVHGLGALLHQGWKPDRTIVIGSWDAEEQGLIGSTEWAEQHAAEMPDTVAYFNVDVAVSGPDFNAAAVPSLKQFIREITKEVPSPKGGSVYDVWKATQADAERENTRRRKPNANLEQDVSVGDLGSGSDYSVFLQHFGVPATDIGSGGPYGVYHSAFDDITWYTRFADPDFTLLQQQARVFGLEILHMADADVLPYDYLLYAHEIHSYLDQVQEKAHTAGVAPLNFAPAYASLGKFTSAATAVRQIQLHPPASTASLNSALRQVETDWLLLNGLPRRPWYRHAIFAPGEYTGYAAVVLPQVNEAVEAYDAAQAQSGLADLSATLERAAATLQKVVP